MQNLSQATRTHMFTRRGLGQRRAARLGSGCAECKKRKYSQSDSESLMCVRVKIRWRERFEGDVSSFVGRNDIVGQLRRQLASCLTLLDEIGSNGELGGVQGTVFVDI
jgi:hypothetical protein